MNRFGIPLVPTALFLWMTNFSDRFFLVWLADVAEAGIYSVGVRIASAMVLLLTAFRTAWPAFAYSIRDEREARQTYAYVLTYLTVITAWVALALSVLAPWLVDLLADDAFAEASEVVGPLAFSTVAYGAYIVVAIGVGRARRTQFNWVVTGIAAAVNVALNLALIPAYGMIGAAIATVAAYGSMAVGMGWWSQRIYPVPYQWRRVATAALAAVALAAIGGHRRRGPPRRVRADRRLPASRCWRSGSRAPSSAAGSARSSPSAAPDQPRIVCSSRNAFSETTSAVTAIAATVVERRLTSEPISDRSRQNHDERDERERDPEREDDLAQDERPGRVDADRDDHERRRHRDRPPQEERDPPSHEALHHDLARERADARRREAGGEQGDAEEDSAPRCRAASESPSATSTRSSPISVSPLSWNTAAAVMSMLMLTSPAMLIAITTSTSSKRKIRRFSSSVAPTTRCCVSAECR